MFFLSKHIMNAIKNKEIAQILPHCTVHYRRPHVVQLTTDIHNNKKLKDTEKRLGDREQQQQKMLNLNRNPTQAEIKLTTTFNARQHMHCNFTILDLSNFQSGRNENIFSQINSGFVISKMNVLQTSRFIAFFLKSLTCMLSR